MRYLAHLARRFVGSWRARRPGPDSQRLVAALLSSAEAEVFWAQPVPDLAHGVRSAEAVLNRRPDRSDLARAALLHDVGKRHSRLGTIGRSVAAGLSLMRIPVRGRFYSYLDHAEIGARELEALGCDELVVAFTRHHHRVMPAGFDGEAWTILAEADDE